MNLKDKISKKRNFLELFERTDTFHQNCIRINTNNSLSHELLKFLKAWKITKEGRNFMTEARFFRKFKGEDRRIDLVDIEGEELWEFETNKKVIDKQLKGDKVNYILVRLNANLVNEIKKIVE